MSSKKSLVKKNTIWDKNGPIHYLGQFDPTKLVVFVHNKPPNWVILKKTTYKTGLFCSQLKKSQIKFRVQNQRF